MAGKNNIYNDNDSMDINELAALNGDVSDEMLEQLTAQLTQNIGSDVQGGSEDGNLFEEPISETVSEVSDVVSEISEPVTEEPKEEKPAEVVESKPAPKKEEVKLDESFDDNFIKKYKARLNKQALPKDTSDYVDDKPKAEDSGEPIEKISQGNITEKTMTQEQIDYNDSLDFLDGNVKYSKYVIYVDPQNVDFIESLTVKERKNLINGILKQQGDITLTKRRFKVIETVIRHAIVAILTITVSIPVIYYAINTSLEATINNHRQSQTVWQTLYREHGKISPPKN